MFSSQHETNPHGDKADPNFQYGTTSVAVALSVLIVTLVVIIVSLVLTHRAKQSNYPIDEGRLGRNDDNRRLLESPTPEEEAENFTQVPPTQTQNLCYSRKLCNLI